MATERYVSHTEPEALIPFSMQGRRLQDFVDRKNAQNRLAHDITAYLAARRGFWWCLRHRQLRAWWRFG